MSRRPVVLVSFLACVFLFTPSVEAAAALDGSWCWVQSGIESPAECDPCTPNDCATCNTGTWPQFPGPCVQGMNNCVPSGTPQVRTKTFPDYVPSGACN